MTLGIKNPGGKSTPGANGESIYQIAVRLGLFTGTEAQFVTSMQANQWRFGSGVPNNAVGKDGDQYVNTATGDLYIRASGTYSLAMNLKGQSGLVDRGVWAASTVYKAGDLVSYLNAFYTANADFTSGATFNAANWTARYTTPNPNIVTTLDHSAIPNDRFAALVPGSTALEEAQPWPLDLADATLYYKDPTGLLRMAGVDFIPNAIGGGSIGQRVVLIDKPTPSSPNYSVVTPVVAAALQPTVTQAVKELGIITGVSQSKFTDRGPLSVVDTSLTPVTDTLTTYTQGTAAGVSGVFVSQGAALSQVPLIGTDAAFPSGLFLRLNGGSTSGLHVLTREDTATMVDGAEEVLVKPDSGGFSAINLFSRFTNTGGTGTETGLVLRLTTGGLSLWTLVNGVWTQLKKPDGTNATYSTSLAITNIYRVTWQWAGTKVRAKIRLLGAADPGWQVRGWQSAVLGAGKIGWGNDIGYTKIGQHSIVRTADLPPAA